MQPMQPASSAPAPVVATAMGTVVLSGWWRRFGAYLLDSIIVAVPTFVIGLIVGSIEFTTSTGLAGHRAVGVGTQVAFVLTAVVVAVGYPFVFLRTRGQTPGMMAFKIRAIDRVRGGPLTTTQTWQRVLAFFFLVTFWSELVAVIDFNTATTASGWRALSLITFAGLLTTALWPLNNPGKQTLQDKAGDTIVILTAPVSSGIERH
jgi:uncharacterized RDD family membrane protein YckC